MKGDTLGSTLNHEQIRNMSLTLYLITSLRTNYTLWLSWKIAIDWGLPEVMVAALKDLRNEEEVLKKSNDSLSRILFTSNLVSELNILQSSGGVSSDVVLSILTKNGLEEDQVKEILTLLN